MSFRITYAIPKARANYEIFNIRFQGDVISDDIKLLSIKRFKEKFKSILIAKYQLQADLQTNWSLPSRVAKLSRTLPQKGKRDEGTAVRRLLNSLRVLHNNNELGQREAKNRLLYFKLLHFTCISQLFDFEEGVHTVLKENVNDTQLGCKIFMILSVRRATSIIISVLVYEVILP